jgi:hypothetical protein
VARRHALVAKHPGDLEDALEAADQETLQVQLRCDPQEEIDIEGVVVGDEGPRCVPLATACIVGVSTSDSRAR